MNHFVCVCFQIVGTIVLALGCTTENTSPVLPTVLDVLKTHIAVNVVEMDHGVLTVRKFGAIQAAPGEMRGQFRNGDAVKLMLENMIRALLQIRVQRLKTLEEPFRNFTQKHTTLAGWVYQDAIFDTSVYVVESPETA